MSDNVTSTNAPDVQPVPVDASNVTGQTPLQSVASSLGVNADTSQIPLDSRVANAAPSNQGQAPAAPAQEHRSFLSDILHAVGDVLGGPKTAQKVDASGNIVDVPLNREERIGAGIARGLVGAGAGMAQHGPGSFGKSVVAGSEAEQKTEQQQKENNLAQSQNIRSQLASQATRALQTQQMAELGWRMSREQTEVDQSTADKLNTANQLVASDARNKNWGHYESFADFVKQHSDLKSNGVNLVQLQAQGRLIAIPTTEGGKVTGVQVYQIEPDAMKEKTTEPTTIRKAVGLDSNGKIEYKDYVIPPGVEKGKILDFEMADAKDGLDSAVKVQQVKQQGELGKSEEAKNYADANKANTEAKALITSNQADPFGNVSDLPQKEMLKRQDSFQKDVVNKAYDTEKSYNMASQAYGEYQAAGGKLPTGAQSMLLLSQHLSTTFGGVKGSRVTKDMIQEHLGARSVSDSALVAIQRLTNGDQLSPDQWKAFVDLIGQSRNETWENAIGNAKNQHLPITFLPRGNGQKAIDPNTAKLYMDAADGDAAKARTAAQKQGWVIPQQQ